MGAVYRPKDLDRGYKKIIDSAISDLSPDTRENVIKLFNSWEGTSSKDKLSKLVGPDRAKDLMKKIKESGDAGLTSEERNALKEIFKDSLTFD
jgi:DNA-directed RNA polymerase subunit F